MNTLQTVFEQQKRQFASGVTRSYEWRVERDFNVVANSYMEALVQPITWEDWPENERSIFQGFRSKDGETMVLQKNMFVENLLPRAVLRRLSDDEMAAYRAPFANPLYSGG